MGGRKARENRVKQPVYGEEEDELRKITIMVPLPKLKPRKKEKDNRAEKEEEDENLSLSVLPIEAITNVLLRLPLKSTFQYRCVSKTWYKLLKDDSFTSLQTQIPRLNLVFQVIFKKDLFMYEINWGKHGLVKLNKHNNPPYCKVDLVGSCNGFICLFERNSVRRYYLCNPITGNYSPPTSSVTTLPKREGWSFEVLHGFGYDPKSNEYMVIRITKSTPRGADANWISEGEVYSFGKDETWFNIRHVPFPVHNDLFAVAVNGSIHWLTRSDNGSNLDIICALDIATRTRRVIEAPHEIIHLNKVVLGVLGDCLYLCDNNKTSDNLDIWMLKNYGDHESWSKEIVIPRLIIPNQKLTYIVKVLTKCNDEEVLVHIKYWFCKHLRYSVKSYMGMYNTRRESFSTLKVPLPSLRHGFKVITHDASFDEPLKEHEDSSAVLV